MTLTSTLNGTLVVIPTLSASRLENVKMLIRTFESKGAEVIVVANGSTIFNALRDADLPVVSSARNLGFGAAVNLAAPISKKFTWLMIVNDDIEISDTETFGAFESLNRDPGCRMITFGDEPFLPIPDKREVFINLSLLSGIRRKVTGRRRMGADYAPRGKYYFPFSIVAISWQLWEAAGGLDERFPFTYEDADFTRRALDIGALQVQIQSDGISHLRSQTGRSQVATVLPVGAWSGYEYLKKWSGRRTLSAVICIAGLVFRFTLLPFSKAGLCNHMRGTIKAISAIARNEPPALPDYDTF